ncbi:MAG: carbohydrate kinase family protein [Chloroflexota bacterium]
MPPIPRPRRPARPGSLGRTSQVRIVVLGDLMLDVVLAPASTLRSGTDVPGRVSLVQGGSAATTARWLGRLGARSTLIAAVGRDATGRALVDAVRADHVTPHVTRVAGARTGRIGVLVAPGGERTFVADRGAADLIAPDDLRPAWFAGADAVHLPVYSLLGQPLGLAGRRAVELARAAGASVSVDLASIGPLLAGGRRSARALIADVAPDLLFATTGEADAFLGGKAVDGLLDVASTAVVKRGPKGATVLSRLGAGPMRFEVATEQLTVADSTGAGDAFDAGFLVGWFGARASGRSLPASLQRAAVVGHRTAARQLTSVRAELPLG